MNSFWHVIFFVLHWTIVGTIAYVGLRNFVRTIQWSLLGVVALHTFYLALMLYECGRAALDGVAIALSVNTTALYSFQAWHAAFALAVDVASWALPNNCAVASGLLFRTSRWTDSSVTACTAVCAALYLCLSNFATVGCLAARLHTRIRTVWKPRHITRGDIIITEYFKDYAFGPIIIACNYLAMFCLHMWSHAALAEAIVISIAEPCKLLDYQTTLLIASLAISMPFSAYAMQYAQCDLSQESDLFRAFSSVRIVNGAVYAANLFWLYGVQTLADDQLFMYGYVPVAAVRYAWKAMPAVFMVFLFLDIKENVIENKRQTVIRSYIAYLMVSAVSFLTLVWLCFKRNV